MPSPQVGSIVTDEPPVKGFLVAVRAKGDIDGFVSQQQTWALYVLPLIERQAAGSRPGDGDRAIQSLLTITKVERMEIESRSATIQKLRDDIQYAALQIDYAGPEDSDFVRNVAITAKYHR